MCVCVCVCVCGSPLLLNSLSEVKIIASYREKGKESLIELVVKKTSN